MSTYDITTHGARSEASVALYTKSAEAFEAFALEAEALLSLDGTTFTGDDAKRATLAVVLQVNFLLATDSDYQTLDSQTRGPRSVRYKPSISSGVSFIDNRAKAIVADLGITLASADAGTFATIRRLR